MPAAPPTYRQFVSDVLDDNCQRNGRDREEDSLHAQGQEAQGEPHEGADGGCGPRSAPRAAAPKALSRNTARVDAHPEKRTGAEIHVTGIAAEDTPCDAVTPLRLGAGLIEVDTGVPGATEEAVMAVRSVLPDGQTGCRRGAKVAVHCGGDDRADTEYC